MRLETFEELGVEFVSISEQVDTSTAAGKMIFTVRSGGGLGTFPHCRKNETWDFERQEAGQENRKTTNSEADPGGNVEG